VEFDREKVLKYLMSNSIAKNLFGESLANTIHNAIDAYDEKHRYYHNINHLIGLFSLIYSFKHTKREKEILELVALFHDVVYDPRNANPLGTNEELSVEWFDDVSRHSSDSKNKHIIRKMVLETQYGKMEGTTQLSQWFNEADLWTLIYGDANDLIKNEMLILKEYQFNAYPKYKEGRIKFLEFIKKHDRCLKNASNILSLEHYVEDYIPSIGIYAGSFNPFHVGHLNILEKASKLFDKVVVAIGQNPDKAGQADLMHMTSLIPFYEVDSFSGALADYIKSIETYANVTLVRGLRNGNDFNYEINQLRFIEDMYGGSVPVVLIPCDRQYDYISSSAIRGIRNVCNNYNKKYLLE